MIADGMEVIVIVALFQPINLFPNRPISVRIAGKLKVIKAKEPRVRMKKVTNRRARWTYMLLP